MCKSLVLFLKIKNYIIRFLLALDCERASHAVLINLIRLFHDGRKKGLAKQKTKSLIQKSEKKINIFKNQTIGIVMDNGEFLRFIV